MPIQAAHRRIAQAWGGSGTLPGVPPFVVTHHAPDSVPPGDPPYTFDTDGIEYATEHARTAAGAKDVSIMGASMVQQCLRAGRPAPDLPSPEVVRPRTAPTQPLP